MILLLLFSFLAGVVTILSPCILPILPIILSGSFGQKQDKLRPYGIVLGFVVSFTLFTLLLTSIVRTLGIDQLVLRNFAVIVIGLFGLLLIFPKTQMIFESLFNFTTRFNTSRQIHGGLFGGIILGISLGLIWTPCVGPILASVISLALTESLSLGAFMITFTYSVGTAVPMLIIILSGRSLLGHPFLSKNLLNIQKGFGVIMVMVAVLIYLGLDKRFQEFVLDRFPNYGTIITKVESNESVNRELEKI